jgi:hypothetical protein
VTKIFAIGDIHGAYKALIQCFERSGFDRENTRLIVLSMACGIYASSMLWQDASVIGIGSNRMTYISRGSSNSMAVSLLLGKV